MDVGVRAWLGDVPRPGAALTSDPGAVVAHLVDLVAPDLPSRVDEVEYTDPVASIRGADWILTLVCPWRLWRDGNLVIDPDLMEGDEAINAELVAGVLWDLIGHSLVGVQNSSKNVNDPVFVLTGGYVIEVEADTDIDPWTFSLPGMTFVGTTTVA